MGLLSCPKCNRLNQTTRSTCWSCHCRLVKRNPDEWSNGTYAYRKNPGDSYALRNTLQIADCAEKIYKSTTEDSGSKNWIEHLLAIVRSDMADIVHKLRYSNSPIDNSTTKYMARANAKLIKNYADELANMLNSRIELEDWMKSKLSASANRMDDIEHALEYEPSYLTSRHNPIDPNLGVNIAKHLFFTNPKGEKRMRSMNRFRKNPNSWSKYLNRRNPQKAVWGDSLFGKSGVWGNTLYKSRRLRRRNPQAPVWGAPNFGKEAVWGKTLFRNPQPPVWQGNLFGKNTVGGQAWGKTLFRRHRNPQPPVWQGNLFGKNTVGGQAWGKTLFKRRNPHQCPSCLHLDCGCGCNPVTGAGCNCAARNPQPPVWQGNLFGKNTVGGQAWGKTLFRRNPECPVCLHIDCDCGCDPVTGAGCNCLARNPQPPVWQGNLFGKNTVGGQAWGKTLFRRNPECPVCLHIDCDCGCDPVTGAGCLCSRHNPDDEDLTWDTGMGLRNPQAPVWGAPTFGKDAVWGKTLFRNPDEDDLDDWRCNPDDESCEMDERYNPDDLDEDWDDWRCNPYADTFEEDIDIEETPSFRRNLKRYRRNS